MTRRSKRKMKSASKKYQTPEDLPHEIIEKIIFLLEHPYDHLSFAKSCSTVYRAYTPKTYRLLCIDQGFSRSKKDETLISWQYLFHSVLGHADTCKEVYCKQFGKPGQGKINLSDLLKHPKESLPPPKIKRKLHIHLRELISKDLRQVLNQPFLSVPISSHLLDTIYRGLEDTKYLITFWSSEIRQVKGSLGSHPPLGWAFCCYPPITSLTLQLHVIDLQATTSIQIENSTGVTVYDVILNIHECLQNNLPRKIREQYPKNLQTKLTWYDHLKLADKAQKSRLVIPIENVELFKSVDEKEWILKISMKQIAF